MVLEGYKYEYNNTHGDAAATSPIFHVFFVELWERFGYYGVQGVLAFSSLSSLDSRKNRLLSLLVLCCAGLWPHFHWRLCRRPPAGTKRTIVLGALVLAIGYFMTACRYLSLT